MFCLYHFWAKIHHLTAIYLPVDFSLQLSFQPLPGLLPQDEDGDAGEEAAEEAAQPTDLAHVISVAFDETARDARAAYA